MTLEKVSIKEINNEVSLSDSLNVIKDSFITVARELNLTEENCPSNPAFANLVNLLDGQVMTTVRAYAQS